MCKVITDKLLVMEIQHTRRRIYAPENYKVNNLDTSNIRARNAGFGMKQVIFWIMVFLALICVISLGMIIVNYSVHAKL